MDICKPMTTCDSVKKIAFGISGYSSADLDLVDNLDCLQNKQQIDFYVDCREGSNDWTDSTNTQILHITNLCQQIEARYQEYKNLDILHDWPLVRGVLDHLLSLQHLAENLSASPCIQEYQLIVFCHSRIRLTQPLDLLPMIPTGSLHFCNHLSVYCPNPMWMVVPPHQLNVIQGIVDKLYIWLQSQTQLDFPWGLVQGTPSKFNWGLILAQYFNDCGIICHHNWYPIHIIHHPMMWAKNIL